MSDALTISLGALNAMKYNVTLKDESNKQSSIQTQIAFTKDSRGFVIAYSPSKIHPEKDLSDIKTVINSFKIETKNKLPIK